MPWVSALPLSRGPGGLMVWFSFLSLWWMALKSESPMIRVSGGFGAESSRGPAMQVFEATNQPVAGFSCEPHSPQSSSSCCRTKIIG